MSAAVAAAVKKIAIYILGDENKRGKLFVAVGSIIAGFLGLMFLPIAVISSIGVARHAKSEKRKNAE